MSNRQTITAIDSRNNVTYIQWENPSEGNHVYFNYDDDSSEEQIYEIEKLEEVDAVTDHHEYLIEEEQTEETYEILESVVIDQKVQSSSSQSKKSNATTLIEKKMKPKESKKVGRKSLCGGQTREMRKNLANTNKSYINAKGKEVVPKVFDEDFECTCPKSCTEPHKLPLKTRRQIFNMFWSIGTYEGRCAFINSCVAEVPKKRCYTKNKEQSRRKNSRKYYLKGNEVCKKTFVRTLMISNSRIDVCLEKMETENFADQRGKRKTQTGFAEEKRKKVINHMKKNFVYGSTLRSVWNSYLKENPDDGVSESYFKKLFHDTFDYNFKRAAATAATLMKKSITSTESNNEVDDEEEVDE